MQFKVLSFTGGSRPELPGSHLLGQKPRVRPPVISRAAGLPIMSLLSWLRPPPSPAKQARQELVSELGSPKPDRQKINALLDQLLESSEPFDEASLGGGPWQVVFSRGPVLWQQWTTPGKLVGAGANIASQDFQPQGRKVVNFGQVVGEAVFVTAEGTYAPQDDSPRLPKLIKATIESGALHAFGRRFELPIKGSGLVYLAYLDDSLRVFQSTTGAVTVQIREDKLQQLLGRE